MNYSKVSSKDQAVISPRSILKISPWIIQRSISIKLLILILFLNFVRYIYIYILYGLIYSFFFIPPKVYTWLPPISVRRPYFPYTTFAEKYPYETGVILLRPTFDREHERVRVTFWGVGELQVTVYRYLERSDFIFTIIDYDYRSFFFSRQTWIRQIRSRGMNVYLFNGKSEYSGNASFFGLASLLQRTTKNITSLMNRTWIFLINKLSWNAICRNI